jgi:hypothetical protein
MRARRDSSEHLLTMWEPDKSPSTTELHPSKLRIDCWTSAPRIDLLSMTLDGFIDPYNAFREYMNRMQLAQMVGPFRWHSRE